MHGFSLTFNRRKVICVSVLITTHSDFCKENFSYNSVRFLNELDSNFLLSRAFQGYHKPFPLVFNEK